MVQSLVVDVGGFDAVLGALVGQGRRLIGPVVRDGVVVHDEIESVHELPVGWTDRQEPGHYRLEESPSGGLFGFASAPSSWKPYVFPERTLLLRARRSGTSMAIETPEPEPRPVALIGVHGCDLAALGALEEVFVADDVVDPTFARRRADAFIVAVGCHSPATTCFCASMGTGPTPTDGHDLLVHELIDDDRHEFLVEVGSSAGEAVLDTIRVGRTPTGDDERRALENHERATRAMSRGIDGDAARLAASVPDHAHWDSIAERCLSCANCTMVCPTCFCSATVDSTDLAGVNAERWRVWDSCFANDFSALHGGVVRSTTRSRYRQWLLHKLERWHDQYGRSGCVGCGRCITWCPVGIDLTVEIAHLAAVARQEQTRS